MEEQELKYKIILFHCILYLILALVCKIVTSDLFGQMF